MPRKDDGPAPDLVVVTAGIVSSVVAYADLFGADVVEPGGASLFAFVTVLAFLVPAVVVLRVRVRRWLAHPGSGRWPDVVLGAAATALVADVVAHVIGEGGGPGLLAAVLGAAAIGASAARARSGP